MRPASGWPNTAEMVPSKAEHLTGDHFSHPDYKNFWSVPKQCIPGFISANIDCFLIIGLQVSFQPGRWLASVHVPVEVIKLPITGSNIVFYQVLILQKQGIAS